MRCTRSPSRVLSSILLNDLRIRPHTLIARHPSKHDVRQASLGEPSRAICAPLVQLSRVESGVAVELVVGECGVDGPGDRQADVLDEVCGWWMFLVGAGCRVIGWAEGRKHREERTTHACPKLGYRQQAQYPQPSSPQQGPSQNA